MLISMKKKRKRRAKRDGRLEKKAGNVEEAADEQ
jgi:hypothetical protein